jgi:hypothetical protein
VKEEVKKEVEIVVSRVKRGEMEAEEEKQVDENAGVWSGGAWTHAQRERSPLMSKPQQKPQQSPQQQQQLDSSDEHYYIIDGHDADANREDDEDENSRPRKR